MPDEGNLDPPSLQLYHEGYLNFISTTKMGEKLDNKKKKKRKSDLSHFIAVTIHRSYWNISNISIYSQLWKKTKNKKKKPRFLLAAMEH